MISHNIKRRVNIFFSSTEPDWFWGIFCILFSVITICYLNRDISIIHYTSYFSLPLFDFFRIPSPQTFIEHFLPFSISLTGLFSALKFLLILSLILSLFGVFQRFFIILSFMSFFLFEGWISGYSKTVMSQYETYPATNIIFFILLVWLFAPLCKRWTILFWLKKIYKTFLFKEKQIEITDTINYPIWPRLLVILTIGIVYFGSFYCKLDTSGFQWINGYTLQGWLLQNTVYNNSILNSNGYWLAQKSFYLIWFLNIVVYFFQFTAPVGFLLKETRFLYIAIGAAFHIGVFLFFGFWFKPFQYYYVVFFPEIVQFFQRIKSFFVYKVKNKKIK